VLVSNSTDWLVMSSRIVENTVSAGIAAVLDGAVITGNEVSGNLGGIVIDDPLEDVLISNNLIEANSDAGLLALSGNDALTIELGVDHNLVLDNGGPGIAVVDTSPLGDALFARIEDNSLTNQLGTGITVSRAATQISDNTVAGTSGTALMTGRGIELSRSPAFLVEGNVVEATADVGVAVYLPAALGTAVIADNQITGAGTYGVSIQGALESAEACLPPLAFDPLAAVEVSGNHIVDSHGAAIVAHGVPAPVHTAGNTAQGVALLDLPGELVPYAYGVAMCGSAFRLQTNALDAGPAAAYEVLFQNAQDQAPGVPSTIGPLNQYTLPQPLGFLAPAGNAVVTDAVPLPSPADAIAEPMPCPWIPTDATSLMAIANDLLP
jgi:hypothetical protein